MDYKKLGIYGLIAIIVLSCTGYLSYNAGQKNGIDLAQKENAQEREHLYELNRSDFEHLDLTSDKFYVIGHKSPDADTVMSAIAVARFFNALGFNAIPVLIFSWSTIMN